MEFRPATSLRAKATKVDLNGKPVPFQVETRGADQHIVVEIPVASAKSTLRIRLQNEFGLGEQPSLPKLGSVSHGLRILSQTWSASRDQLALEASGAAGGEYWLRAWNAGEIQSVEGAEFNPNVAKDAITIHVPASDSEAYPHVKVVIHFLATPKKGRAGRR